MADGQQSSIITVPEVKLISSSDHRAMPVIGMGMAAYPVDETALKQAVLESVKLGYRHFDTAAKYGSERPLGEALADAISLGLVASREEFFITSKLWPTDAHVDLVIPALEKSLSFKPGKIKSEIPQGELMPTDFNAVWGAMEVGQRLGLTKSIGVSNFSCKKLQNTLSFATIPPSANQVEMNPIWQQKKLIEFCKAKNIIVTAFSPLGAAETHWGSNNVLDSEILQQIAKDNGKTVAQVCLRWLFEKGATFVVKSFNKERMKQNLEILDWGLTEEDHKKISAIPQQRFMLKKELITPNGPFKTLDDLWNGEL